MRILSPLGWLGLLSVAPLVLWYLLRPRRRAVLVPSTFLWRQVERPATAATPWQRFRGDATFWLVLLALLGLTFALLRPGVPVPVALGDHTILVVDASGSMQALEDGERTRADLARREVADLLADLAPGQTVSLVAAGARAEVLVASAADARTVDAALATLVGTHGPPDLGGALALATALQRPGERSVVQVITDADLPDQVRPLAPPGTGVLAVGTDQPNAAVTRVVATVAGGDDTRLLTQVRSYALVAVTGRVVASVDDAVVVEQPVRLAPRERQDVALTVPGSSGDVVEVRLVLDADEDGAVPDALAYDDVATVVLPEPTRTSVLVAGPGSPFLLAALEGIEGVEVTTAPSVPDDLAGTDLLIVDRTDAPAELTVPTFLVGPTSYPTDVTATGAVERPSLTFQASDHPILADADLTGINVAEVTTLDAPALTPLATGPRGALLAAGRSGDVPLVVLPFELTASDLPLRPAWPVLVANVLGWTTSTGAAPESIAVGSTVALPVEGRRVQVVPPDGGATRTVTATASGTAAILLDRVGTWRIEPLGDDPGETTLLAVTAGGDEGDLTGSRTQTVANLAPGDTTEPTGLASLVRPIVLGVLLVLLLEWVWSQRVSAWWRRRRDQRRRGAAVEADVASPAEVPLHVGGRR
jgi:Ca-activated chloride channel family protein